MKRIIFFALAGLMSTAVVKADVDIVANAIEDSDVKTLTFLTVIGTTHNNSFAVTKEKKAHYVELAKKQLEEVKDTSSVSFEAMVGLDIFSIFASAALAGGGMIGLYDIYTGKDDKKNLKTLAGWSATLVGIGNTIKSAKDLIKNLGEHRTKAKKDIKKAEEVLKLVEAMPIKA